MKKNLDNRKVKIAETIDKKLPYQISTMELDFILTDLGYQKADFSRFLGKSDKYIGGIIHYYATAPRKIVKALADYVGKEDFWDALEKYREKNTQLQEYKRQLLHRRSLEDEIKSKEKRLKELNKMNVAGAGSSPMPEEDTATY